MKMKTNHIVLALIVLSLFSACKQKNVQNNGGVIMDIEIGDSSSSKADITNTAEIIKKRVETICTENPIISINGNSIHIEMPLMNDTNVCKTLLIQKGEFDIIRSYEAQDVLVYLSDINKKLVENKNFNFSFPTDSNLLPDNPLFNLMCIEANKGIKKGPASFNVMQKDTALIDSVFNHPVLSLILPSDLQFKWAKEKSEPKNDLFILISGKVNRFDKLITSEMIQNANTNDKNGSNEIEFELKQKYHQRWKRITLENVNLSLIILIDDCVIAYHLYKT